MRPFASASQNHSKQNFIREDSVALSVSGKEYKDPGELARDLTKGLSDDLSKFRVIYRWVAENISYDQYQRSAKADKALRKRRAVCAGYSNLLCDMCNAIGIPCEMITGFSKHSAEMTGKSMKKPDHGWNAVKLSGNWNLCDITWFAGFYDERSGKMTKRFSDTYFLMPPAKFIYNHFPKENKWQLLDTLISKSAFEKLPFAYPRFFAAGIKNLPTKKGVLKLKLKDTLGLELESILCIDSVNMELEGVKTRYTSGLIKTTNTTYIIKQKFDMPGNYILIVYVNRRAVLGFRIKVQE